MENQEVLENLLNLYERRKSTLKTENGSLNENDLGNLVLKYIRPLSEQQQQPDYKQEYASFIRDCDLIIMEQKCKFYEIDALFGTALGTVVGSFIQATERPVNFLYIGIGAAIGLAVSMVYCGVDYKLYKNKRKKLLREYTHRLDQLDNKQLETRVAFS